MSTKTNDHTLNPQTEYESIEQELQKLRESSRQAEKTIEAYQKLRVFIEKTQDTNKQKKDDLMLSYAPLGQGIFVPCELDTTVVSVHIGLGYFVEMTTAKALNFIPSAIDLFQKKVENIQETMKRCEELLNFVNAVNGELQNVK